MVNFCNNGIFLILPDAVLLFFITINCLLNLFLKLIFKKRGVHYGRFHYYQTPG
jgi:hypothetical protein